MVDLVKIRQKARKKGEAAEPGTPAGEAPSAHDGLHLSRFTIEETIARLEKFKADAGRRRELLDVTEAAAEGEPAVPQLQLLTFVIGGESYALDIEPIIEIVATRPATRVPNTDPSIVGILSLRGTIVTLVDVRARLRHPPGAVAAADRRIIVVDHGGDTLGFEVDRVLRVINVDRATIEPHPVVHHSEQNDAIQGVFLRSGALTILLDFDKLLDATDESAQARAGSASVVR